MKKTIIALLVILLIVSLTNFSFAADLESDSLSISPEGVILNVNRWTIPQANTLSEICEIIESEVIECDYVNGQISGVQPLSLGTISLVKVKNEEFSENLWAYSYLAHIYSVYGADSITIPEELKISGRKINKGRISFLDSVTVGRVINPDFVSEKIILQGSIDYDKKSITLDSANGDSYHRAGTFDDEILKEGSLTIEPLIGAMDIGTDDAGNFEIFGIETFIPAGSRIQTTTTNPFKVTYSEGRFLNVQINPITATEFSFVKKDARLWLNGNGKFQVIETGTELDKGTTVEATNSYDLSMGYIGKVYVDKEGRTFYDIETKEIEGETYVIKERWKDIPATVGTEKAGINIIKILDEGVIVINEEGKFFISTKDYLGEGKTDNFFIAIYEFGGEQLKNIKDLITGK